ncbi:MAG: DUF5317 domain-containing protein [Actinomycetes bacterium]
MALVLAVTVGAFVAGRLAGGTLPRLVAVPVRGVRLLVVAFALQVGGGLLAGTSLATYPVGVACSAVFVVLFLVRNGRLLGVPLVAAGLLGNIAVVVANGAMPVSADATVRAGVATTAAALDAGARTDALTAETRLGWLADRIPVALPLRRDVASPGDVLIAAGLALYVAGGMCQARGSAPGHQNGRQAGDGPSLWETWPRPEGHPAEHRVPVREPHSNVRSTSMRP